MHERCGSSIENRQASPVVVRLYQLRNDMRYRRRRPARHRKTPCRVGIQVCQFSITTCNRARPYSLQQQGGAWQTTPPTLQSNEGTQVQKS